MRWLQSERSFLYSSAIFLVQFGYSLAICYIIVCGKISSVVVDTLNGGNSGLLTVLYVFYSVLKSLICYK